MLTSESLGEAMSVEPGPSASDRIEILWAAFPSECMIVGEDNVAALAQGRATRIELAGAPNAGIDLSFTFLATVVSFVDATWNLMTRLTPESKPEPDAILMQEEIKRLSLQLKLSDIRQRELLQKILTRINDRTGHV